MGEPANPFQDFIVRQKANAFVAVILTSNF
jgi:hypothetical protein